MSTVTIKDLQNGVYKPKFTIIPFGKGDRNRGEKDASAAQNKALRRFLHALFKGREYFVLKALLLYQTNSQKEASRRILEVWKQDRRRRVIYLPVYDNLGLSLPNIDINNILDGKKKVDRKQKTKTDPGQSSMNSPYLPDSTDIDGYIISPKPSQLGPATQPVNSPSGGNEDKNDSGYWFVEGFQVVEDSEGNRKTVITWRHSKSGETKTQTLNYQLNKSDKEYYLKLKRKNIDSVRGLNPEDSYIGGDGHDYSDDYQGNIFYNPVLDPDGEGGDAGPGEPGDGKGIENYLKNTLGPLVRTVGNEDYLPLTEGTLEPLNNPLKPIYTDPDYVEPDAVEIEFPKSDPKARRGIKNNVANS